MSTTSALMMSDFNHLPFFLIVNDYWNIAEEMMDGFCEWDEEEGGADKMRVNYHRNHDNNRMPSPLEISYDDEDDDEDDQIDTQIFYNWSRVMDELFAYFSMV